MTASGQEEPFQLQMVTDREAPKPAFAGPRWNREIRPL